MGFLRRKQTGVLFRSGLSPRYLEKNDASPSACGGSFRAGEEAMRGGGAGCSEGGELPGPGPPAGAPQMRGRAGGGGTPATPVAMATRPRPCISDKRKSVSKGHGFVGERTPIPAGPALEGVPGSSAEASPRLDQGAGARGASTCTTATLWQPPRSGQHLGAQRPPRLLTRACPVQTARSARPRLLPAAARGFGASGLRGFGAVR